MNTVEMRIDCMSKNTVIHETAIIGKDVVIGRNCIIEEEVIIGDGTTILDFVYIGRGNRIGKNCFIGHYAYILWENRIDDNVCIGAKSQIEGFSVIGCDTRIQTNVHLTKHSNIGKRCFIGPSTVTSNTYHPYCKKQKVGVCVKGLTLEDDVILGSGCVLGPSVSIAKNSFVSAGVVLFTNVEKENSLVVCELNTVCVENKKQSMKCKIDREYLPYMGE